MNESEISKKIDAEFNTIVKEYIRKYPSNDNFYKVYQFIDGISNKLKNDISFSVRFGITQTEFNRIVDRSSEFAKICYKLENGGIF